MSSRSKKLKNKLDPNQKQNIFEIYKIIKERHLPHPSGVRARSVFGEMQAIKKTKKGARCFHTGRLEVEMIPTGFEPVTLRLGI